MYVCSNHIFFYFLLLISFLKKRRPRLFELYQGLFIRKKLAADDDAYLGCGWSKIWLFRIKSWFFCNGKHFSQNIMIPCYWHYNIFYVFNFFQIIKVSLFLAWHDQYFIMFKDSNVFDLTNFPFKRKYKNTVDYSVNSNYLFTREKQEKNC